MEKNEKIYPLEISRLADWEGFAGAAKNLFGSLLPPAGKLFLSGFMVFGWLILQVLMVGVCDRLGVSPKISLPVSSLFFSAVFAGLAVVGGIIGNTSERDQTSRPICKILIIRRRKQEIKI